MTVFITGCGVFLPGEPLDNDEVARRLGDTMPGLRKRIMAANGIHTRHFALDQQGEVTMLNEELAARAAQEALKDRGLAVEDIGMLATGTTQGDLLVPGFASMVHGRLEGRPMELLSAGGVCASSMTALAAAARAIDTGAHDAALVVGSELVSRAQRRHTPAASSAENADSAAPCAENADSAAPNSDKGSTEAGRDRLRPDPDVEFLRWTLSDGAGAVVLENAPRPDGLSLRVDWLHLVSYAHERKVCMSAGGSPQAGKTWLDPLTPDVSEVKLRQDVSMLPDLFRTGVHEFAKLIRAGKVSPAEVDHLLCHYSAERFRGDIVVLLKQADLMVDESKWFTNLHSRGNTGAASIFVMLEDAWHAGRFAESDRILLVVPESGRFSFAFAHLTCVTAPITEPPTTHPAATPPLSDVEIRSISGKSAPPGKRIAAFPRNAADLAGGGVGQHEHALAEGRAAAREGQESPSAMQAESAAARGEQESPSAMHAESAAARGGQESLSAMRVEPAAAGGGRESAVKWTVLELARVWEGFERELRRVPMVRRIEDGDASVEDYRRLLLHLRQQVIEGGRWISRAASNFSLELFEFRSAAIKHAADEHRDYQMLERDFVASGGTIDQIRSARKNVGSEALSAFIFQQASQPDPVDLLGAMFIIEGLGNRLAMGWARRLQDQLGLRDDQVSFLAYHGEADEEHIGELNHLLGLVNREQGERVVRTAEIVARLYALQLEEADR